MSDYITIYLIRHARQSSSLCNVNVELSKEGIMQSELLAERLQKCNIKKVYSSDLIRAVETADIIEDNHKTIRITLKYKDNVKVLQGLKRISKPGLRIYASVEDLPRVLNGLGIAIISTSKGIMTDKAARNANVGGEVIAYVW